MSPLILIDGKLWYTLSLGGMRRVYTAWDKTLWVYIKGVKHCIGYRNHMGVNRATVIL